MESAIWAWHDDGTHFCSECSSDALYRCSYVEPYIYVECLSDVCPHCGRTMVEL